DEGDADTDRIQDVLAKHDFPHVVVKRGDFAKDPDMYMNECYVLLLNCHGLEHPLPRAALDRIKSWVENGGYLYTEDSDLVGVTGALWPDRIDAGQPGKPGPLARKPGSAEGSFEAHFPVRLVPAKGITSHPLLRGALRKDAVHMFPKWEVQDRVPAIVVKDRSVVVLLEAPELAPLAQNNTAAAITFAVQADKPDASKPLRRGRVLHVLAHYGQQDSRQDNQALDNVLLNFLLEATKKR
ncbi:hypothetical protein HY251_17335, partial [bacterium]|nr:hypothetical protein [bacterium]